TRPVRLACTSSLPTASCLPGSGCRESAPIWRGAVTIGGRCSSRPSMTCSGRRPWFPALRCGDMNAWTFERVAGPYQGALCGVAWDGNDLLFCAETEGRILRLVTASAKVEDFRRYTPRVSGIAFGPGGELYG